MPVPIDPEVMSLVKLKLQEKFIAYDNTVAKVYAISFSEYSNSYYVMHKDVKLVENSSLLLY